MPSEVDHETVPDLGARALARMQTRVEAFRSALRSAEEEIRAYVVRGRGASAFQGERALIELGPFAIGRIDPERFAMLMDDAEELTADAESGLDRAEAILSRFQVSPDLHRIALDPGGDLRDAVKDALTRVGQVFGTARAVELARAGLFDQEKHGHLLEPMPFRLWNRAERQLAPPLVVDLGSEDLLPAGLGEFLDGSVVIVLVASGPTAPAPLARLITPGTFVMQTADPAELGRLAGTSHPGVALLFDGERPDQARFVHDPDAGSSTASRLSIEHLPEPTPVGRGRRAPTWLEEIAHLRGLAAGPDAAAAPEQVARDEAAGVGASTPVDQLASWLLEQTDLEGLAP